MQFSGESEVRASRSSLWGLVNRPAEISKCIPGVEEIEIIDNENFKAAAKVGIGIVKSKFSFQFAYMNMEAPRHAELKAVGTGSGRIINLHCSINLTDVDSTKTKLVWTAEVELLGPLAPLASRFLRNVARDITNQLFDCIRSKVETN